MNKNFFEVKNVDFNVDRKVKVRNVSFSIKNEGAYYFTGGWHLKGIYSLLIGFIFAASTIWNYELRFLQSFSWIIGAFFSSLTYYLLVSK